MDERAIVDTSPFILLVRVGLTSLLQLLAPETILPDSIEQEIRQRDASDPGVSTLDRSD